jgi:uncharacterized membrane protein YccC
MPRLGLRLLLPDLATGLRAAIATVGPFYLAIAWQRPELMWVALGGWLGSMADPGGARRDRATAIVTFAVLGGIIVAAALAAAPYLVGAAAVIAVVAFGGAVLRVAGGAAATLGTLFAVTGAIAVCAHGAPLTSGALFTLGASWAVVLSSILWPVRVHLPLRRAVSRVYGELARYADEIAAAGAATAWAELARSHQRAIRAALEQAQAAAIAIRARRRGETVAGANLRVLLGEAEAQFFDLIALAEEIELAGKAESPVLGELAPRYREIAQAVLYPRGER